MKTVELFSVTGVLLALALLSQPAVATNEFLICCEGQLCNGGGAYAYEYMLLNNSTTAVTLTEFFVGTMDPNIVNYSFFLPAGFTATIILNDGFPPCNVTYTSLVQTPHGALCPRQGRPRRVSSTGPVARRFSLRERSPSHTQTRTFP